MFAHGCVLYMIHASTALFKINVLFCDIPLYILVLIVTLLFCVVLESCRVWQHVLGDNDSVMKTICDSFLGKSFFLVLSFQFLTQYHVHVQLLTLMLCDHEKFIYGLGKYLLNLTQVLRFTS